MSRKDPDLLLQTTPVLRQGLTTPRAMRDVWLALLPVILAAIWFFGLGALLLLAATVAGALMTEWVFTPEPRRRDVIRDQSGLLTGLLLGLTLPPGLPGPAVSTSYSDRPRTGHYPRHPRCPELG